MALLRESKSVLKALELAQNAHRGQVDKGGQPYILHPMHVAESLHTEEEQIAGLLHDVVEDTYVTLEDLRAQGFEESVVQAVDCLTHRRGEPRETYLNRIAQNPLAVRVKLADLAHNSDLSRIPHPVQEAYERAARYRREMEYLRAFALVPRNEER